MAAHSGALVYHHAWMCANLDCDALKPDVMPQLLAGCVRLANPSGPSERHVAREADESGTFVQTTITEAVERCPSWVS